MLRRIVIILGIIGVLVVAAAFYLIDQDILANATSYELQVITAAQDLPANTVIDANMLVMKNVKKADLLVGTTDQAELIVGKKVAYPIYAGEQIILDRLKKAEPDYKPDERDYAIETTYRDSVGGEITVGDYVDIFLDPTEEGMEPIPVLGGKRVQAIKDQNGAEITAPGQIPSMIVFRLKVDEIVLLRSMAKRGELFCMKYGDNYETPLQIEDKGYFSDSDKENVQTETPINENDTEFQNSLGNGQEVNTQGEQLNGNTMETEIQEVGE